MGVEFGLLGDVAVWVDGQPVDVGHARQRCVLVVLLVEATRPVSVDQLVNRVWGYRAPRLARETLYNYLSRLRRALYPITEIDLVRQAGGYVLNVDPMAVDIHRFGALVAQARAATDENRSLVLFEQALGLWRGEPCAGLDTAWINALRNRLERDRFAGELDRTDLQLRRGGHGWLLGEMAARAAAHPLDERVAGQLMLALYHNGRQAEALEHFQQLRVLLAEELGIDPGPGLQRRYEQILTTDPALTAPPPAPVCRPPPVPRQLPPHTPHFVGRAAELRQLATLLDTTTPGGTVVITTIDGSAGVGKTALALHWAHQAAEHFPDGQLYVNLRGFDPTGAPMCPADALRRFLEAFAIPPEQIPTSLDAQASLYRSLLTDRRVLVVLDNARDTEQVRPLLPASPTCLVVITSRNQLTGLVSQQGARPITIDLFSPQEARALLAHHLGPDRVSGESGAITDLIHHCARLPLALAIVAARADIEPGFTLRVLAKELADEHTRLDALDTGDVITSVRSVFSWSYRHLSRSAARVFRLLGLNPGPDIALPAITQLADFSLHQVREALRELIRAHLLTQHTSGRYTFHDLLRVYAIQLSTTHDSQDDRHAALTRLFDHYLHTTTAAMDVLHLVDQQHPPCSPATPSPPFPDPTTARTWLETERANLTAIIAHTAAHGWHTHTTRLANTVLFRYLEIGVRYNDALAIYTHARHAAHHIGDRATEALALTNLGLVDWREGRYQQAADHHQHALAISRDIGFRAGEALALTNLGLGHWRQGHCQQAAEHHQHAVEICRHIGDRSGEAHALTNLGLIHRQQGRYQQATDHHQQALEICRDIGFRAGEALALTNLGLVHGQQGRYQQATDHNQRALAISREIGCRLREVWALGSISLVDWRQGRYQQATDHNQQALAICAENSFRLGEALALTNLGLIYCQRGRHQQAVDHHQHALTLCRDIGDLAGEAQILNGLGEAYHASGQLDVASSQHTAALTLAGEIGDRYEQARAHHGLARTHHTTGDLDHAHQHWQQALTRYVEISVPDADDVRTHLATLNQAWAMHQHRACEHE